MQSEHAHEARAVAKEASDQAEGIWVLVNFRMRMAKMIFEKKSKE
jgi:ribosomal protein S6